MKITILSWDLSHNCLGRAYLLGEILACEHQVEIVGSVFGEGIWTPVGAGRIACHQVAGARWPRYAASAARLLRMIDGDLVFAVKPRPSSFGAALIHRIASRRPIVLDIDDDEEAFTPAPPLSNLLRWGRDLLDPNGGIWTRALGKYIAEADALTVASRGLQQRYGGVLVPHAKDTERLRPHPDWVDAAKEVLCVAGHKVLMFLGTPRPHKGISDLAAAARRMRHQVKVVVIGADPTDPYTEVLRSHPELLLRPPCSLEQLPFLLHAADVVVIPQHAHSKTVVQTPSKVFDAMALAKPIVATAVSDLPDILANGRGVVVPPSDEVALANAVDALLDAPEEAARMGARARGWCEENASYRSARLALREVLDEAFAARAPIR